MEAIQSVCLIQNLETKKMFSNYFKKIEFTIMPPPTIHAGVN